jgi:hypothetical protein
MSKNIFYCDLDLINGKGVLVTGHGKGLVNKNEIVEGQYICNDMVRLKVEDGKLLGYQGYIEKDENEYTEIDYLLYFYNQNEDKQPEQPAAVEIDKYIMLSKHNIVQGEEITLSINQMLGEMQKRDSTIPDSFEEFKSIVSSVQNVKCYSVPYTKDENERARFLNLLIS